MLLESREWGAEFPADLTELEEVAWDIYLDMEGAGFGAKDFWHQLAPSEKRRYTLLAEAVQP